MEQEGEGLQPRVTGAPQPPALPPWPPLFSCPRPQGPGQNPCLDHCPMGWGEALTHRSSRASGEQPPFPGLPQSQGPRAGEKETWGSGGPASSDTLGTEGHHVAWGHGQACGCHTEGHDAPCQRLRRQSGKPEAGFPKAAGSWGHFPRIQAAPPSATHAPNHSLRAQRPPAVPPKDSACGAGLGTTSACSAASPTTRAHPAIRGPPPPIAQGDCDGLPQSPLPATGKSQQLRGLGPATSSTWHLPHWGKTHPPRGLRGLARPGPAHLAGLRLAPLCSNTATTHCPDLWALHRCALCLKGLPLDLGLVRALWPCQCQLDVTPQRCP